MSGIKKQSWKVIGSLAMLLAAHSVAESAELELRQLNWLGTPDGDIMASRIFEAELSFNEGDPNDLQLLQQEGGGYVNIAVQAGDMFAEWAVRNVYLAYPDVERLFGSSPSFQFGLPIENGTPIGEAFVIASITPQVLEEPFPQIEGQVMVTPDDYMTGGRVGGGTYLSDIPFTLGPLIDSSFDSIPVDWAWVGISVDDIAEVDENIDGCAPGSCARSISYLGDLHDLDTEDPQDIFADLKEMMNTGRPGGTSDPDMLAGKDEYTSENGLPIESHLTYGDDSLQEALDAVQVALDWDRETLYNRINRRVEAMAAQGWVEEVQQLIAAGYETELYRLKALGYREIAAHLRGEQSLEDAIANTQMHHRRYAKRQLAWFRADTRIQWVDSANEIVSRRL